MAPLGELAEWNTALRCVAVFLLVSICPVFVASGTSIELHVLGSIGIGIGIAFLFEIRRASTRRFPVIWVITVNPVAVPIVGIVAGFLSYALSD